MDTLENFRLLVPFYHLPTSDNNTTERSLRPIFAVSTFAPENVVREFTRSRGTFIRNPVDRLWQEADGVWCVVDSRFRGNPLVIEEARARWPAPSCRWPLPGPGTTQSEDFSAGTRRFARWRSRVFFQVLSVG